MNILLLGSGARENALAYKMSQSPLCDRLYIAPGNGGSSDWAIPLPDVSPMDFLAVARAVALNSIDLVVAGNEDPLVGGLREGLMENCPGVLVIGPGREGARLEGSKDYAKRFMARHGIPTAAHLTVTAANVAEGEAFLASLPGPYVLKADGLAAGKGVIIVDTLELARTELRGMLDGRFGEASRSVVIEEFMEGEECSVFVLTDGTGRYRLLPVARDYKRALDGDLGPNTGGMGSVSPVSFVDDRFMDLTRRTIVEPTLQGLIADGVDYRGFIFFGLINVGGQPKVIEYNVRMGDPETESVMRRVEGDLVAAMKAAAEGSLDESVTLGVSAQAAATVVLTAEGYPAKPRRGDVIDLPERLPEEVIVFHGGTRREKDGRLVTSGGRVLAVTAVGPNLDVALGRAYEGAGMIEYEGKTLRTDIGVRR